MRRNKILLVMPTRGRPRAMLEAVGSIMATTCGYADLLAIQDSDDCKRVELKGPHIETVVVEERLPMLRLLNKVVLPYLPFYDIIGFTGDDVIFETASWDVRVWNILKHQVGVVYGIDGIQDEKLPTHPFFSSIIPMAVGYIAPPVLHHYYLDQYLKDVALGIGALFWRPELITRHKHHSIGGLSYDRTYVEAEKNFGADRAAYAEFALTGLAADIEKVAALTAASVADRPDSHTPIP